MCNLISSSLIFDSLSNKQKNRENLKNFYFYRPANLIGLSIRHPYFRHFQNNICVEDCCDGNCIDCSGNIEICKACKPGFSLNLDICDKNFSDKNCEDCNSDPKTCTVCKEGFWLNTATATVKCDPCKKKCASCISLTQCTKCLNGRKPKFW